MERISKEQVKHVAELARLGLTEKEIEKFQKQLSAILEYIEILNEVDTEGVEPTLQTTGLTTVMQEDEIKKDRCLPSEDALSNAPEKEGDYFKVKKIL